MKIATLQLAPKLGDLEGNIEKANALLQSSKILSIDKAKPDILVLPELALTGMLLPNELPTGIYGSSLSSAIRL
jgi:protein N-terminal amidase